MMLLKIKFISILFFVLVFTNCTIQKRTVNKGYFVQWNFSKNLKKINISKTEQDSLLTMRKNYQFTDSTKVTSEISNVNEGKLNLNLEPILKIEEKEKHLKTLVETKKFSKPFSSSINLIIEANNTSSEKYYNKEKGKKAGRYFLISSLSFLVMILAFLLVQFSNLNMPEWFYDIFLVALLFISLIAFLFFGFLALIVFISAFFKPKEKSTSS